jgi:hypothetical protein
MDIGQPAQDDNEQDMNSNNYATMGEVKKFNI